MDRLGKQSLEPFKRLKQLVSIPQSRRPRPCSYIHWVRLIAGIANHAGTLNIKRVWLNNWRLAAACICHRRLHACKT